MLQGMMRVWLHAYLTSLFSIMCWKRVCTSVWNLVFTQSCFQKIKRLIDAGELKWRSYLLSVITYTQRYCELFLGYACKLKKMPEYAWSPATFKTYPPYTERKCFRIFSIQKHSSVHGITFASNPYVYFSICLKACLPQNSFENNWIIFPFLIHLFLFTK